MAYLLKYDSGSAQVLSSRVVITRQDNDITKPSPGHLKALRDGRRPGQRPPIQSIIEWLAAKRLKQNPYAVANIEVV